MKIYSQKHKKFTKKIKKKIIIKEIKERITNIGKGNTCIDKNRWTNLNQIQSYTGLQCSLNNKTMFHNVETHNQQHLTPATPSRTTDKRWHHLWDFDAMSSID